MPVNVHSPDWSTRLVTPHPSLPNGSDAVRVVAYFTMEAALAPEIPTYAGGLGVLAGDTLRAAADLGLPIVGVSLLHSGGYFRQRLDATGVQSEASVDWTPDDHLEKLAPRARISLDGRPVTIRAWCYRISGYSGFEVPVYLLDTQLPENASEDREITDRLYIGDDRYRLRQEAVLGLGGLAMMRALGFGAISIHHLNEGHSALLALGLLQERLAAGAAAAAAIAAVREHCVFTTHTPVPAGHDRFPLDMVASVLGVERTELLEQTGGCVDGTLNMTHLALHLSGYVNGVAMRHRAVSEGMFPGYPIDSVTNGVHARTWVAPGFGKLYDRHIPEWRFESFNLRYAIAIPLAEVREAHAEAKRELVAEVASRTGSELDPAAFTIGFARRATSYKRADLLFSNLERLRALAGPGRALQVLYAGKAHPHDTGGKALIRRVFEAAAALAPAVRVLYLQDYDMALAAKLCAGVDLWLNTPQKPQEASGTSGMKAAMNGVPSLSVLDGWWVEGHVEGVTGWSIGESWHNESDGAGEATSLYDKLEHLILPLYYDNPDGWAQVMRSAVALNASFFNAERMLLQYAANAYGVPVLPTRRRRTPVEATL